MRKLHSLASDEVIKGLSIDEFHDDKIKILVRGDIVDDDNIGMAEGGGGFGLLDGRLSSAAAELGRP
ncbi:MAG: hypothetical protein ABIJ57_10215 [Pseudomonadota bacterium]|nr:hypothetical protein [Candidatus Aminicenantes bacterium]